MRSMPPPNEVRLRFETSERPTPASSSVAPITATSRGWKKTSRGARRCEEFSMEPTPDPIMDLLTVPRYSDCELMNAVSRRRMAVAPRSLDAQYRTRRLANDGVKVSPHSAEGCQRMPPACDDQIHMPSNSFLTDGPCDRRIKHNVGSIDP